METWTKQMNYPYIKISKEPDGIGNYAIQQHRFLEDPSTLIYSTIISPYNYVWQIPITYRTSDSTEAQHLLLNSSDTVTLNLPDTKWIKFNVNFTGYYSVNYDVRDWRIFVDILKNNHKEFSPSDRVNLLFDSFSLASAGLLDYEIPLSMSGYLKNETFYGGWNIALKSLDQIKRYFKNDRTMKDIIKEHIRSLTKNLLRKYTWQNDGNYSERRLRLLLIDAACNNGHHDCLLTAGNLFNQWKKGAEIDPGIRSLVYTYGLRVLNDEASWDFLWHEYLAETDPDNKADLQKALTLVRNATMIERFIDAAKNGSIVRKHDYFRVLQAIAENYRGFAQVTSLIFNNWTDLVKNYGGAKTEKFAYNVFKLYDTEKDLKKVRDFYRKNKVNKDGQRYRTLAIESILENIRWHEMHKAKVKEWFEKNVYMPWKKNRLPRHIKPSKYNITVQPNISQAVFEGIEEIDVTISEPTDYLLVHELGLKIHNIHLIDKSTGEIVPIDESFPFKKNNYYVIQLEKMIPEGEYALKLNFTGTIIDEGDGVGRYTYTHSEDLSERYIIATKFEPTDARRMFPCFDEPDMKAKFKLALIHENNYTALSNMPLEMEMPLEDNMVKTVFQETVDMSTYLLCCVISDFDYIEGEYKGMKVRAYAAPDRIQQAEHGLNITIKTLAIYERYFDVPYALPKLDSVAIPRYNVPAMEHWGVITYNEFNFLVDDVTTPYSRMFNVDRVVAHELAHQWFGNLVTMKWWNDLWLNEGFSTLIMYMPLGEYHPGAIELEVRRFSRLMCTDSSVDSHAILRNISNIADISDLFDNISYEKGSAVLKMLQYTLQDDFMTGISNYLKKYAFKNAETKDLWEELSKSSNMDLNITEMMDTWTLQMGFPYIELKRDESSVTATQRWFLRKKNDTAAALLAQAKKLSPFEFVWQIPLKYKNLATGKEHTLWLKEKNGTFPIIAKKDEILKFNPDFVGYYIVKYDEDDYQKLGKQLQEDYTVFSVIDRYNLLHDAFLLAESDRLLYDIPLEFTKYLKNERELMPWIFFRDRFTNLLILLDGNSETAKLLKEYVRKLTEDIYDEVVLNKSDRSHFRTWGYTGSSNCAFTFKDLDLLSTIMDLACRSANDKCLDSLKNELHLWIQGENTTADIQLVLRLAIPYAGNQTLWNLLYDKLIETNVTEEQKADVLEGLASFTGRKEIMNSIDVMANDPALSTYEAQTLFEKLGTNPVAIPALWEYAKNNYDSLVIRFGDQESPSDTLSVYCETFEKMRDLGDFIRFLKSFPQVNDYILEECIEDIQEAVRWSEKYEETIQNWLRWNLP